MNVTKRVDVLSLGVGVQSSSMFFMAIHGDLQKPDYVIFADPGFESKETYEYLEYIKEIGSKHGIEVHVTRNGNIKEDLLRSLETGERAASMPFYTYNKDEPDPSKRKGMVLRQCTSEYKIIPINKKIRELLGYKPRQKIREDVHVWKGISTDEIQRMKGSSERWITFEYPLIDNGMNRLDCMNYISNHGYKVPPKSSCIFCPFHNNEMWLDIKKNRPDEWKEAVEIDKAIRNHPKFKAKIYLHKSCKPLDEVDLQEDQLTIDDFINECEGFCGV